MMPRTLPLRVTITALFLSFGVIAPSCGGPTSLSHPSLATTYIEQKPSKPDQFVETSQQNTSTFGADVDTGSYTLVRRGLTENESPRLPEPSNVRSEEFLNFFKYSYPSPETEPFRVTLEGAPSPFGEGLKLMSIGIKAREVPVEARQSANLVFLIDVSGSMGSADKIGLVKYALGHLVKQLQPTDTLGIVTYAGKDAVLLKPTPVLEKAKILDAIESLQAGGGTAGEAGIRGAYALAEKAMKPSGVNRVILCTDGDFNIGATGNELIRLIEGFRSKGIFLTTLGFGTGNYKDEMLEQLADRGNGNYAYIDTPNEAIRVLGENLVSTLQVVAKDTKIQIEFNAASVKRYRLIGYENRRLANEDFANDKVDSGDIGAGHYVTALYELELVPGATTGQLAEVRLRYKKPNEDVSSLSSSTLQVEQLSPSVTSASTDLRFAAAVTEFAEILGESPFSQGKRLNEVLELAQSVTPADAPADRREFLELVRKAQSAR